MGLVDWTNVLTPHHVNELTTLGITRITPCLSVPMMRDIREHIVRCPQFEGHVKAKGNGIAMRNTDAAWVPQTSYRMSDIVTAPHILDIAVAFAPHIQDWMGSPPYIYSMNAYWSRPSERIHAGTQSFHRDYDDEKFCALFMYGTDVLCEGDGPHEYILRSHTHKELTPSPRVSTQVYGIAGTMFLCDPRGLHRGAMPIHEDRLLFWIRYGTKQRPAAYIKDKLEPVPHVRVKQWKTYNNDQRMMLSPIIR